MIALFWWNVPDFQIKIVALQHFKTRKGARVVEEARLESVCTTKLYRGFESPSFRRMIKRKTLKDMMLQMFLEIVNMIKTTL